MIAIIMGSRSDEEVMKGAEDILTEFGVPFVKKVISAHRAPNILKKFIEEASIDINGEGEVKVYIAGAGKAAHLPGVIASLTPSPVIGVPIKTSDLGGMDSLLSIVQMPSGIPVATVAINGSTNAGLLAIQMLAINDPTLMKKIAGYRSCMENEIKDLNE